MLFCLLIFVQEKKNQTNSTQCKVATSTPPTKSETSSQVIAKNPQPKTKVQQPNNNLTNTNTRKESVKTNNYKGSNKVVNNMVFESTQNPAAREDFEATGSENFLVKHKKQQQ